MISHPESNLHTSPQNHQEITSKHQVNNLKDLGAVRGRQLIMLKSPNKTEQKEF